MRKFPATFALAFITLLFFSAAALAQNAGDFSGAVAIGTGYAGIITAPTNGLAVQGDVSIGTSSAISPLTVNGIIQSTMGGVKFPDGSVQTTASAGASGAIESVKNQVFTSNGTYTPSVGMAYCSVRLIGGGGGGGGSTASDTGAGGGGAGGSAEGIFTAVAIGTSQTVTIGAGGSGGTAGNHAGSSGGTTSFGILMNGDGGSGGTGAASGSTSSPGGAGGTASGGDIQYTGAYGGNGVASTAGNQFTIGGNGGSGIFGGGGRGGNGGSGVEAGVSYGSGGGGGSSALANMAGAAGANGVVIITEYCTQ